MGEQLGSAGRVTARAAGTLGAVLVVLLLSAGIVSAEPIPQFRTAPGEPSIVPEPAPEAPPILPEAIQSYVRDYEVGEVEAERRLELQQDALALNSVLPDRLDDSYGGVHFDHHAGQFVISATTPAGVATARHEAEERGLTEDEARVREVDASLDQLRLIQSDVNEALQSDLDEALLFTSINTSTNSASGATTGTSRRQRLCPEVRPQVPTHAGSMTRTLATWSSARPSTSLTAASDSARWWSRTARLAPCSQPPTSTARATT